MEYGFTDSSGDDVNQIKNNWESLAEAVVKALADYVGADYYVEGGNYYTVKAGDTLWNIAKNNNTSVDEIKRLNNLSTNNLAIGQKLLLTSPDTSVDTNTYKVVKGDTLYSLANKYNVTVDELKKANNLSTNNLSIGQVLTIPTKESTSVYTVKSGDTLYGIASKYGLTVNQLKEYNNLSSDLLSVGMKLNIPNVGQTYTVKAGDTLYAIAARFNTSVDRIKRLNNLSTNNLSIGQTLKIS